MDIDAPIYQSHGYQNELLPKMLWDAGREISRLCWNPFIRYKDSAPITGLPIDILGEIFQWCICEYGFGPSDARSVLLFEPLVLSHVSRQWREAALSFPLLWSTIWVDRPRAVHVPMVELWLQNSRQCPLILHLRQTVSPPAGQQPLPFTDPREYELTDTILFLLGNHLHRWKKITFLFHHTAQRSLLTLPESPTAAPLLEHIQLLNSSWDDHSRETMGRILYSYASVKSIVMQRKMAQEFIRWDRLTVLDVADMGAPIRNYLAVLERCQSLRRADIRITTNPGEKPAVPPTRPLHLDDLSSLTIKAELLDLAPFFGCLVLPKLEDLSLNYITAPRQTSDPVSLQRLIRRSECVLKRFNLREDAPVKKNDDHHLSFLRFPAMASLVELCLKIDLTDNIMEFLTLGDAKNPDDPRPRWLPNLHTLALKDLRGDHIEDIKLYRMVVSRLPAPTPDRNGRYSAALRRAYFNLRVKDHSSSAVLPVLLERCRERIDLAVYLARCPHRATTFGRYTAPPLAGGFVP
ncbi:hypothetical protein B0H16DRAFT_1368711 [Mycena metata]|uniref:F-box domain-containing protein n=1 Tax=Mycena metata TaxID=1033252 RepID=A0AAD7JDP4_9AGAR|nr:hypothetical protein B0H16DRAFT_1368711 [Mycena metata]